MKSHFIQNDYYYFMYGTQEDSNHAFSFVETQQQIYYTSFPGWGEEVLPYMGYIGMCRCEGYDFQAVYSRIGYINQSVWV